MGCASDGVRVTEDSNKKQASSADDRAEFRASTEAQAVALGQDKAVFSDALNALMGADKYDYTYLWTWMGVPIIQLPADIMATQEVIFSTRPDVVIETGVARGGSLIFMASLLQLCGNGFVIGVDIDIRPHNRESIEAHPMASRIKLIEGPSTERKTIDQVKSLIPPNAKVMVILDSDHSRDHVLAELRSYGPLVTKGHYLVVADTVMGHIDESWAPKRRSKIWFKGDEPLAALNIYLKETADFEPDDVINGKLIFASSPGGYLRRAF